MCTLGAAGGVCWFGWVFGVCFLVFGCVLGYFLGSLVSRGVDIIQ